MYVLHVQTPITFCLNTHFSTRVSALSVSSCLAHAGLCPPVHAHIQPPARPALPAGRRRGRAGPRRVPMATGWRLAPGGGAALAGCRRPGRAGPERQVRAAIWGASGAVGALRGRGCPRKAANAWKRRGPGAGGRRAARLPAPAGRVVARGGPSAA